MRTNGPRPLQDRHREAEIRNQELEQQGLGIRQERQAAQIRMAALSVTRRHDRTRTAIKMATQTVRRQSGERNAVVIANATDLSQMISETWERSLVEAQGPPPQAHPYVYASAYRPCARRMALEMACPDRMPTWSPEMLAKFQRGHDRERDLLSDLSRIGRLSDPKFSILNQQERVAIRDGDRQIIVGKIDAMLVTNGLKAPIEVKSWAPHITESIECFDDLFRSPWTRSAGYQLAIYLHATQLSQGFLILDRSGLPRVIPVNLDDHRKRVHEFVTLAYTACDAIRDHTLPPFWAGEAAECLRCPFYGGVCNPPLASHGGANVLDDPELESALVRRESLAEAAQEYAALDGQVKRQLRGIESGVIGPFQIAGKWAKTTRLELPLDVKAQYSVIDPRGRFTLEITRL